ncbi:MAG: hypothetical protein PQJ60_10895 [Spirochaetales bacterium]|nr:hypothetical protein [Spirochaetales bacterium]
MAVNVNVEINKPKFQKMKFSGYLCLVFAAVLTVLVVSGVVSADRTSVTVSLIGTWLLTGTSLLFGNAGKRIAGNAVAGRAGQGGEQCGL